MSALHLQVQQRKAITSNKKIHVDKFVAFVIVMGFIAKTNAFANAILRKMEVRFSMTVMRDVIFNVTFNL